MNTQTQQCVSDTGNSCTMFEPFPSGLSWPWIKRLLSSLAVLGNSVVLLELKILSLPLLVGPACAVGIAPHCPGVEVWALLSHTLPPSSGTGWLKCVPSLTMVSHHVTPPDIHTASVVPPLWALLPQQGIQVRIKAGVTSCCAVCLQHRQNHIALKSTEHPPKGRQPR